MAKKAHGRRDNRTGSIYKDGDGYRVQILLRYDPATGDPVYIKARAKTHDDAVDKLTELQHRSRLQPIATPSQLTVETYVEQWLETRILPARAPKTYSQYCWILRQHVVPTLGKKRIDHVTRQDVQSLVSALAGQEVKSRAKPKEEAKKDGEPATEAPQPKTKEDEKPRPNLSHRTVALAVTVLHALYETAIRDGLATTNPATYVTLPHGSQRPPQFLTPPQVVALNGKLDGSPVKDLVRFMLATGARLGEATGMRWQDFDLKGGFARICGQLQRINGDLVYRPTTKTNQDRTLTLSPWLVAILKSIKAKQLLDGKADPEGIAFLNAWGRRWDQKLVNTELAKACAAAGIPVVSAHKLRHTAATLALMETGDMHGVQKMLGHQQVALTTNLYGHATAERLRPITDALGKIVRPEEPPAKPADTEGAQPEAEDAETEPSETNQ
jgi:integrase